MNGTGMVHASLQFSRQMNRWSVLLMLDSILKATRWVIGIQGCLTVAASVGFSEEVTLEHNAFLP